MKYPNVDHNRVFPWYCSGLFSTNIIIYGWKQDIDDNQYWHLGSNCFVESRATIIGTFCHSEDQRISSIQSACFPGATLARCTLYYPQTSLRTELLPRETRQCNVALICVLHRYQSPLTCGPFDLTANTAGSANTQPGPGKRPKER